MALQLRRRTAQLLLLLRDSALSAPRRCGEMPSCPGPKPHPGSGARLRILVDMDGVIADFEGGFLKKYRQRYPNHPFVSLDERRGFWVSTQYGELREDLRVSCFYYYFFILNTPLLQTLNTPPISRQSTLVHTVMD